jgi:hypothetical protein
MARWGEEVKGGAFYAAEPAENETEMRPRRAETARNRSATTGTPIRR